MKIAIFFDSFTHGGGAEKLVLELAKTLNADIFTSGYKHSFYAEWVGKTKVFDIGNFFLGFSAKLSFIESAFRFAFFKPEKKYDLYIFSGFFSIFAAWHCKPNIWYCCQPNRTIYDLKEFQKGKSGFFWKLLIETYSFFWKPIDQWIVKRHVQRIACISKTIQTRVKEHYHLESELIYPPIDTSSYYFEEFGDFFFFAGRLIGEKRVPLLLGAFSEMPEKKLAIAGSGPLEPMAKEFAGRFANILFKGRVSEGEMRHLLANCLATVYLPVQEDFGMFPLEGNAAGKACIASNEGGCKETIIQGKNGFLIRPGKQELKKAVEQFDLKVAKSMKQYCVKQAKKYSGKEFEKHWKELAGEAVKK